MLRDEPGSAWPQLHGAGGAGPAAPWVRGGKVMAGLLGGDMGTGEEQRLHKWDREPGQRQSGVASPRTKFGAVRNTCREESFGFPGIAGRLFFPCYRSENLPHFQALPQPRGGTEAAVTAGRAAHAGSTANPPEHDWRGERGTREERHRFSPSKPLQYRESSLSEFIIGMRQKEKT